MAIQQDCILGEGIKIALLFISSPSSRYNGMRCRQSTVNSNVLAIDITRRVWKQELALGHINVDGKKYYQKPKKGQHWQFLVVLNFFKALMFQKSSRIIPSATPNRPNGLSCPILPTVPRWRAYSNVRSVIPVSIKPGQIVLTRILVFWSWYADVPAIELTLQKKYENLMSELLTERHSRGFACAIWASIEI